MEFVDKNGLTVKCSVAEYRELSDQPRLVLKNSITIASGSKPVRHYNKRVVADKVPKKIRNISAKKRMKFIHNRINVLRQHNKKLTYQGAFTRANRKWNREHGIYNEFGGGTDEV